MPTVHDRIRAYAAHWNGEVCADCGETCEWDSETETLACACETRSAPSVYFGNTPPRRSNQ